MQDIIVKKYTPSNANELAKIFFHTIHEVNKRDYTVEQLDAWAPKSSLDAVSWSKKWEKVPPLVAHCDGVVVGFAELNDDGYIDCFYVHHKYQGIGVGKALMSQILEVAHTNNIFRLHAQVSITAKLFFEHWGFSAVREQTVSIRGVSMTNYRMELYCHQQNSFVIECLADDYIKEIAQAFIESNWTVKPESLFKQYLMEQEQGTRECWIARVNENFAGYVTLKQQSSYEPFRQQGIPEISDLNVLPMYRGQGIGSSLIQKCEQYAMIRSERVGIAVGLYADYGSAQRLYIKRGYIPDAGGATYLYKPVVPGAQYPLDDDLLLWFTKVLDKRANG